MANFHEAQRMVFIGGFLVPEVDPKPEKFAEQIT
jgi:hypothetical protein